MITRRVVLLSTIATLFGTAPSRAQGPRNVLVLHQGSANQPAELLYATALRKAFAPETKYQLFEYFLDERFPESEGQSAEILATRFAGKKMDLVMTDGLRTLTLFLDRGAQLWPRTPEVFTFVQFRELPPTLPPNVTGVAFNIDYGATLDLALRLMPDTRQVFYVGSAQPQDESWRGFAEQDFKRFAGRVDITYLDHLSVAEIVARLSRLPSHSVVIYAGILEDATGQSFSPGRICPVIASASSAPVFGTYSTYIGCGIVGGAILDFDALIKQSARLGLQVAERGAASGLPIERASPTQLIVDYRQLQRWKIPDAALPPGTIVRFRPPSVWQKYGSDVLAVAAVMVVLLGVIAALLVERRKRKTADSTVRRLSGRLITASEEERRHIARELHDDVLQRLSLVSSELATLERDAPVSDTAVRRSAHEQGQQLTEIMTSVRYMSHQLHSSKLEMLGLAAALRELCEQFSKQHGVVVEFSTDRDRLPVARERALCFYRVAQEALSNALRHAHASRVEVGLTGDATTLRMIIRDDGIGFDPSAAAGGLGLAAMRERLRLVGGCLLVRSRLGGGTQVTAEAGPMRTVDADQQVVSAPAWA